MGHLHCYLLLQAKQATTRSIISCIEPVRIESNP